MPLLLTLPQVLPVALPFMKIELIARERAYVSRSRKNPSIRD